MILKLNNMEKNNRELFESIVDVSTLDEAIKLFGTDIHSVVEITTSFQHEKIFIVNKTHAEYYNVFRHIKNLMIKDNVITDCKAFMKNVKLEGEPFSIELNLYRSISKLLQNEF